VSPNEDLSMALFCDFENIALGVRDAQYEKFDMKPVLERLLLKGSIVVKKAYCDWERYKTFKAPMHEANFELIEIPHVRQSGKNSADIRMVVDALDLCYTKSHVNTFVIISGDSDFSPLVSKLRENAKRVIGVGVKQSTSDLLIANCDEFIYYDDLVRERESKRGGRRDSREAQGRRSPEDEKASRQELESRRAKCLGLAVATLEALLEDRADDERVWASVLKEALKRRNPGFNESYFGFKTFGALLEEAHKRELLEFGRDEKSGAYVKRRLGGPAGGVEAAEAAETLSEPRLAGVSPGLTLAETPDEAVAGQAEQAATEPTRRRRSRSRPAKAVMAEEPASEAPPVQLAVVVAPAAPEEAKAPAKKARARRPSKSGAKPKAKPEA
jgi:uncharacterized LabA/DUF88 family protein